MKHPTEQQWMELLYGELPAGQKSEIEAHLKNCTSCAEKRSLYNQTHKQLNAWHIALPEVVRIAPQWSPLAKWAAAAALLVSTAFATSRFTRPDSEQIQAQISKPLEEKISRELNMRLEQQSKLLAEVANRLEQIAEKTGAETSASKKQAALALESLRERDAALYEALQEIELKRQNEHRAIREDLEKLALFTDQNLRSTHEQLVELASFNQNSEQ